MQGTRSGVALLHVLCIVLLQARHTYTQTGFLGSLLSQPVKTRLLPWPRPFPPFFLVFPYARYTYWRTSVSMYHVFHFSPDARQTYWMLSKSCVVVISSSIVFSFPSIKLKKLTKKKPSCFVCLPTRSFSVLDRSFTMWCCCSHAVMLVDCTWAPPGVCRSWKRRKKNKYSFLENAAPPPPADWKSTFLVFSRIKGREGKQFQRFWPKLAVILPLPDCDIIYQ